MTKIVLLGMALGMITSRTAGAEIIQIGRLRCEYLADPLGIDETAPRLSWILQSERRGARQTASRILVASTPEKLRQNIGDLWDSGKTATSQSSQVAYAGKPLTSGTRCFWKVKIWDEEGDESAWSAPAHWSMGLLKAEEWKAQWIGWDAVPSPVVQPASPSSTRQLSLDPASWIWAPVKDPAKTAPVGRYYFRRIFNLPEGRTVKTAATLFSVDNEFTLWVNGTKVSHGTNFNDPQKADVTGLLRTGPNVLALQAANVGDSPNPAGLIGRLSVTFTSGTPLEVVTDAGWKVSREAPADWPKAAGDDSSWARPVIVGRHGDGPWGKLGAGGNGGKKSGKVYLPSPHLRKEFAVSGAVARACLYVTAQGFAEMHLNGKRVSDEVFTPGWTDYRKRIYYRTYDVTEQLKTGSNAMGAILGDGWFRGNISIKNQNQYGKQIRLLAQLQIDYADGRREIIASDPTWKAAFGPIRESDMQHGETYDARREIPGWDSAGFDDSGWAAVTTGSALHDQQARPLIQAYPGEPVRKTLELKTVKLSEPKRGLHVFDLGQNFSGWIRLKVKGAAGDKVVMRFGEMLKEDGTVYTANLRSARCTDTYILGGEGDEVWEPHFTFHGFRYVEVTGFPGKPTADAVTGVVIHSDAPMTGSFECSNPMLNRLHSNIIWGQRSNYLEVPTDCPQRDERLGWTGDTQVFIRTGAYNQDVAAFFTKWMVDLMDTQKGDGALGQQAPVFHGHGSPGWADAGTICPWTIYHAYGDTRLLARHYPAMVRFVEYCHRKSKGLIGPNGGFGDWLSLVNTPKDLISTAYFAHSARLLAEMAEALGMREDTVKYSKLFQDVRQAFNAKFVADDGKIGSNTQTGYLLALRFDLLTPERRDQAAAHLIERIRARDWHLSTGFLGVNILLPTLTDIGRTDVAYRLIQNKTYPSWGYSIEQGATTIWERWDSYRKDKGFGNVGMNSFNHYAYGACGEWMFRTVLGIDSDGPGFRSIMIAPEPGGGITYARGHYDSINGRISTAWKLDGDTFSLSLTVPPNTTATVKLPARDAKGVTEGGKSLAMAEGVTFSRMDGNKAILNIASGTFHFASTLPQDDQRRQQRGL